jgi:hypothetical protein
VTTGAAPTDEPPRRRSRLLPVLALGAVVLVAGLFLVLQAAPGQPAADPRLIVSRSFATDAGVQVLLDPAVVGDGATVTAVDPPAHGRTVLSGTTVDYVPDAGYLGDDTFSYLVALPGGGTAVGRVDVRRRCALSSTLVPSCGAWWGAAQVPGGADDLRGFAARVGGSVPVAHVYARDGETFPTAAERDLVAPGGPSTLLFGNIKPDLQPSATLTWGEVAKGGADAYLDTVAASVSRLGRPVLLTVNHEPEEEVDATAGSGRTAADYVAMFRHVVQYVDARVAPDQVVWVWDVTGYPRWESLWPQLYPGDDVVDWVAYDPYLQDPTGCDFTCVANRTYAEYPQWPGFYDWATQQFPDKPLMLAEWGVRESPTQPGTAKAAVFASAPSTLPQFPRLRAVVYFNDAKDPADPTSSRIETSQQSLDAFTTMVASPYLASAGSDSPVGSSPGSSGG